MAARAGSVRLVLREQDTLSSARFESTCLGVVIGLRGEARVLTAAHCFADYQPNGSLFPLNLKGRRYLLEQRLQAVFHTDDGREVQRCALEPERTFWEEDLRLYRFSACPLPLPWRPVSLAQQWEGPWWTLRWKAKAYEFSPSRLVSISPRSFTVLSLPFQTPCAGDSGAGLYRFEGAQLQLLGILKGGKKPCENNTTLFYSDVKKLLK